MTKPLNKKKLIHDFNTMRDFEIYARDQYQKMSENPLVQKADLQDQFKKISREEDKHVKIVETILGLIEKL